MTVHILGVNTAYHESSACLLRDGEIVATAEEERSTASATANTRGWITLTSFPNRPWRGA